MNEDQTAKGAEQNTAVREELPEKKDQKEMDRKELRKLRRLDLLELLLTEREENDRLREKIREQENTIQGLKDRLEDRRLRMDRAGSMAEAALALNHIFEDADAAAKQYLENLREDRSEDTADAESRDSAKKSGKANKKKQ